MDNIVFFDLFKEGYLDNVDVDVDFTYKYSDAHNGYKHTYEFKLDGFNFVVYFDDRRNSSHNGPLSRYTGHKGYYSRDYRIEFGAKTIDGNMFYFYGYHEELGIDPRKIIISVTKITIDFLEKVNPISLYIHNIRMKNEEEYLGYNKRNRINYYYLKKMLPSKWKIERSPTELRIYK